MSDNFKLILRLLHIRASANLVPMVPSLPSSREEERGFKERGCTSVTRGLHASFGDVLWRHCVSCFHDGKFFHKLLLNN